MPAPDDQQLSCGTQPALSITLPLWKTSADVDGAPIVEKEHSEGALRLVDLDSLRRGQ
jgi:hypothetical protein